MSDYPYIPAKPISYGGDRKYEDVRYIVIHYTGNNNDTAKNNCEFFNKGNTRSAGAHFFVSRDGSVYQSIQMKKIAYAVGGFVTQKNGAGSLYKKCTNTNSVSIELCDNASLDPSAAQTEAVRKLVAYIRSVCPNATQIIRHWDVSGKSCPARMTGSNNAKWLAFRAAISKITPVSEPKKEEPEMTINEIKNELLKDEAFLKKAAEKYIAKQAEQPQSNWGAELDAAVKWAREHGILKGDQNGRLMLQKPLTRQEMVLMLYRATK